MKFGALLMPSHPPERTIRDGQRLDLEELDRGSFWIYRDISRQKATESELCKAAEALSDSVGKLVMVSRQCLSLSAMVN